jgi:tetratricopeptide (TPR) repeat protein
MGGGMMATTDWTPVLIVLGLGLLAGLVLAIRFVRGAPAGAAAARGARGKKAAPARAIPGELELELRDLAARRDALLARLAELEAAAPGEVGPARVAHERWDLEVQAAEVLRELAAAETRAGVTAPRSAATAPATEAGEGPVRWKGLAYAIGGAAFFLAAILAVRQFSTQKPGMGPGMGPNAMASAEEAHGGDAPSNPQIDALRAELAAHPDDLEVRVDLAEQYLVAGRLFEAFETARPVLDKEPEHPRALTYVAVVRLAMGQVDEAGKMLDTAVARDPRLAEAWSYRGLVRFQSGRFGDAVKDWETALELRPDGRESLEPLIAQAKERMTGAPAPAAVPPAAGTELPPGHPPMGGEGALPSGHPAVPGDGGMPAGRPAMAGESGLPAGHPPVPGSGAAAMPGGAPAATPSTDPHAAGAISAAAQVEGAQLAGLVELAPALAAKVVPGATLFVIVRPDGMVAGPPVAVRRFDGPSFPLVFALGSEHSMTGAPMPDRVSLEIRLDSDGNAMTRDPGDPVVRRAGVATGTRDLRLVLE